MRVDLTDGKLEFTLACIEGGALIIVEHEGDTAHIVIIDMETWRRVWPQLKPCEAADEEQP